MDAVTSVAQILTIITVIIVKMRDSDTNNYIQIYNCNFVSMWLFILKFYFIVMFSSTILHQKSFMLSFNF